MTTLDTSLIIFKSSVFDDTTLTGGTASTDTISLLGSADIFGEPTAEEMRDGKTQYRKVFIKSTDSSLTNVESPQGGPLIFVMTHSSGGDHIEVALGTSSDTYLTRPSVGWAGTGQITSFAGGTSSATVTMLADGSVNATSADGVVGSESYCVVTNNVSIGGSGYDDVVSITGSTGQTGGDSVVILAAAAPRTYTTNYRFCFTLPITEAVDMYTTGVPVWIRRTIPALTERSTNNSFRLATMWAI